MLQRLTTPTRDGLIVAVLTIDIYYRIEWLQLHTALSAFLSPLFGGE